MEVKTRRMFDPKGFDFYIDIKHSKDIPTYFLKVN